MSDPTKEERQSADARFNDISKALEHYGLENTVHSEKVGRSINGKDHMAKIRSLQKEARQIIDWKMQDNRARKRTYGDGKDF